MPKRKSLPTMILISSLRVHKTMDKTFYISVVVDVHFVLSKAEVTVSYALERKKRQYTREQFVKIIVPTTVEVTENELETK